MTRTAIVLKIKPGRRADAEILVREVAPILDEVYTRAGAHHWVKYTHGDSWIEFVEHSETTEQLLEAVTQDPQHQALAPRFSEVIELDDPGPEGLFPRTVYQLNLDGDIP